MQAQERAQALLTIEAAAQALAVSYPTVRRLMSSHRLQVVRVGRSVRIALAELNAFIEQQQTVSA
jgi:excisionase family DNA binding protein